MFISITFRGTSIDETNKTQQKVRGSKFMFKMSTIHANTCIQTTTPLRNRWCCNYGVVQQPPLPQQTVFQLLHIMDPRTVHALLKDSPGAVVHCTGKLGGHISGGINSGVSLCSMVTVHVSRARCADDKFLCNDFGILLRSCAQKIMKIRQYL